jgi:O-antigen ligase
MMNKKDRRLGGKIFQGEWIIFLLLLMFFPTNLTKYFDSSFAYVHGILVDLLLPKVYLTQFLALSLLILAAIRFLKTRRVTMSVFFFFILTFALVPSLLKGGNPLLGFSRLLEIIIWSGFSFWIARNINWEKDRRRLLKFLSFGVVWVSVLALAQFLLQRNVFGYFFFGEPVIYPSLGGVAKTSFFGHQTLQAYGTFPHPNVLGGVLAVIIPWLLVEGYLFSAGLAILGLLVSFSQVAWLSLAFALFFIGILKTKRVWRALLTVSFVFTLPFILSSFLSFVDAPSVIRRLELLQSAGKMFLSAPLVGVGLGLFVANLPTFGIPSGMTTFLQPVHNIFVLVAAESGLFALSAFVLIFIFAFREAWRKRRLLLVISLSQLIFLGLFDHYLYTLPQGLFITSLTLGFIFSYAKGNGSPAQA